MSDLNKLIMGGRLVADPTMTYMPNGNAVTNFRMAVNSGFGEHEVTQWWNVAVFGKTAEVVNNFCVKGSTITVIGSIKVDKDTGVCRMYEKDGKWYATLEMVAQEVILGAKPKAQENA